MPRPRDPSESLPLTPTEFHVLLSLADEERHGYAILKDVAARTGGEVQLSAGTLYGIVARFLADGLIAESRSAAARRDERRRAYRLTTYGQSVVQAETARLEAMIATARATALLRRPRTV